MKMSDFLRRVALRLGDAYPGREFSRYSKELLVVSLADGATFLASQRPDLFTEYCVVKLRAGSLQDVRKKFDNVFEVTAQTDEVGNVIRELAGSSVKPNIAKTYWTKPPCLVDAGRVGGFVLSSATLDSTMNGRFHVKPPVPKDVGVWVQVKGFRFPCITYNPQIDCDVPLPPGILATMPYWIWSQMMAADQRFAEAGTYLQSFLSLNSLSEQAERLIESWRAAADSVSVGG